MKKFISNFLVSLILLSSLSFTIALPIMAYNIHNDRALIEKTLKDFNLNGVLKDKNQKISGPCWAFASNATAEVALHKKGIYEKPLSEKHLLNWCNKRSSESGWHTRMCDGGILNMSDSYFISNEGPYFESDCCYNLTDTNYQKLVCAPVYSVRGIEFVENNIQSIKNAISKYGAITVTYCEPQGGHAVSLIGWNDSNQSWLIKDSGYAPSCYRWLSFKTKFYDLHAYTDIKKYNPKEKVYQYDNYGATGSISADDSIICSNVFTFNNKDMLKSVLIFSETPGAMCNVYVADVAANGKPTTNYNNWQCVRKNAVVPYRGYSNITVENVPLSGNKAIIVEMLANKGVTSLGFMGKINFLKVFETNFRSYRLEGNNFIDISRDALFRSNTAYAYSIKAIVAKK